MHRRTLLSLSFGAALCGCATGGAAPGERIVDLASGRVVSRADAIEQAQASDFVLLGELHDNVLHHQRRAQWLRGMRAPAAVVVEHLPLGVALTLDANASASELLSTLQGAGFDARGWGWPLHEPLFIAIASSGLALRGGNLPREVARRVAMDGPQALPDEVRRAIEAAPLAPAAARALESDLILGHCGRLPAERLPRMIWAQRGRDAAMAIALRNARADRAAGGPTLLLAGNGHVRRDCGAAQILRHLQPAARVLSVGFVEREEDASVEAFDLAWVTAAAARADPCAA